MTTTILSSNLEARIKKLEEKYRDLKDSTEEANSSIEDLYDTVNNLKAPSPIQSAAESISKSSINNNIRAPTKTDIYRLLGKHCLLPSDNTYIHAEKFGIFLLEHNLLPNQEKLNEVLEYFLSLNNSEQIEMCDKCDKLAKQDFTSSAKRKPKLLTILESGLSPHYCNIALSKLQMLEQMDMQDPEYWKLSQWLDNLLAIPFDQYKTPFLSASFSAAASDNIFAGARSLLDTVIYGQQATKNHMLEIIARMISNPSTCGSVFAVEGVPGCGKTTLIKEGLAQVLGLPFQFISLGGASEAAYLAGQNYTYVGSTPGQIVQALKQAKCMNPIFYFDELDKVSNTERGQEVMNLLIHLTDPAQNGHFQDLYMDGIPIDLSRAIFVFSFNDRHRVSPILLDRMEVIRFHAYTPADKAVIIDKYLIPQVMNKYFGQVLASRIKCVMRNKSLIMRMLVFSTHKCKKISSGGVIKKKILKCKTSRASGTSGIRGIIRRLEKAIASVNLRILEDGRDITKIKKIILTDRLFQK